MTKSEIVAETIALGQFSGYYNWPDPETARGLQSWRDSERRKFGQLLQSLDSKLVFDALFPVACGRLSYSFQHLAASFLLELNLECPITCEEAMLAISNSTLNPSSRTIPFYLANQFGSEKVRSTVAELRRRLTRRQIRPMENVTYWLDDYDKRSASAPGKIELWEAPSDDGTDHPLPVESLTAHLARIDAIIRSEPQNQQHLIDRSKIKSLLGDGKGALEDAHAAVLIEDAWSARHEQVRALAVLRRYEDACAYHNGSFEFYNKRDLETCERELLDNPSKARLWAHRGWLLAQLGHYHDALDSYKTAFSIRPQQEGMLDYLWIKVEIEDQEEESGA